MHHVWNTAWLGRWVSRQSQRGWCNATMMCSDTTALVNHAIMYQLGSQLVQLPSLRDLMDSGLSSPRLVPYSRIWKFKIYPFPRDFYCDFWQLGSALEATRNPYANHKKYDITWYNKWNIFFQAQPLTFVTQILQFTPPPRNIQNTSKPRCYRLENPHQCNRTYSLDLSRTISYGTTGI